MRLKLKIGNEKVSLRLRLNFKENFTIFIVKLLFIYILIICIIVLFKIPFVNLFKQFYFIVLLASDVAAVSTANCLSINLSVSILFHSFIHECEMFFFLIVFLSVYILNLKVKFYNFIIPLNKLRIFILYYFGLY